MKSIPTKFNSATFNKVYKEKREKNSEYSVYPILSLKIPATLECHSTELYTCKLHDDNNCNQMYFLQNTVSAGIPAPLDLTLLSVVVIMLM